jgi:drug/metabolite transporter (DMT)-like permease
MAGTLFSFMAMAICGRELSNELNTFQILLFRGLVGLSITIFLVWRNNWKNVATRQFKQHCIRNIAHFGGQFGWFYGIAYIPLAEVFALEFTVPIWTAVLATFMLSERLTSVRITAIGLGFLGMIIILRPGMAVVNPVALAVLGGAFCYAFSHTLTKKLAQANSPLTILFYMTTIQLPLALVPTIADWTLPSLIAWPWIIIVGTAALTGHYCLARALSITDAIVVVPLDFLRLPLIAAVGMLFYGEPLEWPIMIGAGIMMGGNLLNIHAEEKRLGIHAE